jgi:hypothetical protein
MMQVGLPPVSEPANQSFQHVGNGSFLGFRTRQIYGSVHQFPQPVNCGKQHQPQSLAGSRWSKACVLVFKLQEKGKARNGQKHDPDNNFPQADSPDLRISFNKELLDFGIGFDF